MKRRNRCLVMVLVIALLLAMSDTGIGVKRADAATETTAYLEFAGTWDSMSSYPGGSDSMVIADNATVDGNGVYRVSLDFTQCGYSWSTVMSAHGIANCIVRIKDGEGIYGSTSYIQVRSVKIISYKKDASGNITAEEEEKILKNINTGYTYADGTGQTSFCLFSSQVPWTWTWDGGSPQNQNDMRSISGEEVTYESAQDSANYQLLSEWSNEEIKSIEVTFAFAEDKAALDQIPDGATPKPHTTPDITVTEEPTEGPSENPGETPTPTPTWNPGETPTPTPTWNPGETATPTPTPTIKPTTNPGETATPTPTTKPTTNPGGNSSTSSNEGFVPPENIVSNSTYNGQEKIFVNKSALVVAAGSHASVTIALLRGASSNTYITATSANSSIAVPTLQPTGKLDIAVPTTAPGGSSTTITLRFGNSSAAVKVTVSNPVMKAKGAKTSYTIKRKKTATVSVKLTPKNAANATTDTVTASISKKKIASVTSVKLSKNKASIKVKALKKGSAKLKVKAGGKSASVKIKVK